MATTYREAAQALWGPAGHDVYNWYDELLPHYPHLPETGLPIVFGMTAYGRCIGITRYRKLPRITLSTSHGIADGKRGRLYLRDVLAHEMLHAELRLAGEKTGHRYAAWRQSIMRLSPAILGYEIDVKPPLKSVRVTDPKSGTSHIRKEPDPDGTRQSKIARWPQSFRPKGYDYGEPFYDLVLY